MPIKIHSDRLAQVKKDRKKRMTYSMGGPEYIPVDLYGARTDYPKGNPGNLKRAAQDIKDRFDMDLP